MAQTKKQSRLTQKHKLIEAASKTEMQAEYDVVIVGGGASGLVAAITLARASKHVCVLEKELICGKKILATGNGRCNFTNSSLPVSAYSNADFVASVFGNKPEADILSFFTSLGLSWAQEDDRLYPASFSAASVQQLLLLEAKRLGVTLACGREASEITALPNGYRIDYRSAHFAEESFTLAGSCIIASGGSVINCVKKLKLSMKPFSPILCALGCKNPPHLALDGKRGQATLTLMRKGEIIYEEMGEILFRQYGLSGIPVFNTSRYAQEHDELHVDLVPYMSAAELQMHLLSAPNVTSALYGLLDPQVADVFSSSKDLVATLKDTVYIIDGPQNIAAAQVSRGGITCNHLQNATLECKLYPELYAVGEAVDIDGACGGYNLSWAWLSGMRAAEAIIAHS